MTDTANGAGEPKTGAGGDAKAKPPFRVAVVAIHGVSDQQPYETAAAITNLLLNIDRNKGETRYTPFAEEEVRVAVRPLQLADSLAGADPGLAFMHELLEGYEQGEHDAFFETIRLRGSRLNDEGKPEREVHVYEMYWADLSRLGTGILDVFGEFGQILFHLCELGQLTVKEQFNSPGVSNKSWWKAHVGVRWCANFLLTLVLPVLNVFALALAFLTLMAGIGDGVLRSVAWGGVGVAIAIAAGLLLFKSKQRPRNGVALLVAGSALIAAALWYFMKYRGAAYVVAIEWCIVGGGLVGFLLAQYAKRKPSHAGWTMLAQGGFIAVVFLTLLVWPKGSLGVVSMGDPKVPAETLAVVTAVLWTLELIFTLLGLAWFLFSLFTTASVITGGILCWRARGPAGKGLRAAIITGWVTLTIPAMTLLFAVLGLDAGLLTIFGKHLADIRYQPLLVSSFIHQEDWIRVNHFFQRLIWAGATPQFSIISAVIVLGIFITAVGLLPAVLCEVSPPKQQSSNSANQLGQWLSDGFSEMGWMAFCFVLTAMSLAAAIVIQFFFKRASMPWTEDILAGMGLIVAGSATGFVAFRGRLQNLALGFRPAIDALLDVDNHLRRYPEKSNPRSQIAARCASLFRYLQKWEDPVDRGKYSAIVIIAHSQGTAIIVETLRYAKYAGKDYLIAGMGDAPAPAWLFTMGCPLRQLYGWRFPRIYGWAADGPEPAQTGVMQWINAYRSGDYVGRALWKDRAGAPFTAPFEGKVNMRPWPSRLPLMGNLNGIPFADFCIGAGAHTHYWDETAEEIAQVLDRLIVNAC